MELDLMWCMECLSSKIYSHCSMKRSKLVHTAVQLLCCINNFSTVTYTFSLIFNVCASK